MKKDIKHQNKAGQIARSVKKGQKTLGTPVKVDVEVKINIPEPERKLVIQSRALKTKLGKRPVNPAAAKTFAEALDVLAEMLAEETKKTTSNQNLTIIQPQHVRRTIMGFFKDESLAMSILDKMNARGAALSGKGPETIKD